MCHAKRCRTCGKTTWAGCGAHVAAVRASVPPDRWCGGHAGEATDRTPRWLRRLLGGGGDPA
jgi:hypothetical protein